MMVAMRGRSVRRVGLSCVVAAAGLLSACAGDSDGEPDDAAGVASTIGTATAEPAPSAGEPSDTDAPGTESPATESPATESPSTEPPATEPAATEPAATEPPVDDGRCLVGDWVVTEAEMDAYYAGLMTTVEAPLTIDTTGSAPLSFAADGTYAWAPTFALTVDVAGQVGSGEVGGTITGNWTAADGVVTTSSDVNALAVSITVNGVTFAGDDLANGLLNSSPVNGVTYSCDGPSPVLDFKTAEPDVTVPVTLTPA
jgi:hypothetical protein